MHQYSIEGQRGRLKTIVFIVVIGYVVSVFVDKFLLYMNFENFLDKLNSICNLQFASFIDITTAAMWIWITYEIFDKIIWKIPIFGIPNLSGEWIGNYTSTTFKANGVSKIKIKQTWTHMVIVQKTENSMSYSEIASLDFRKIQAVLKYQYQDFPKNNAPDTMKMHVGFAELYYNDEDDTLEGTYFTDKNRRSFGDVTYRRKNKRKNKVNSVN